MGGVWDGSGEVHGESYHSTIRQHVKWSVSFTRVMMAGTSLYEFAGGFYPRDCRLKPLYHLGTDIGAPSRGVCLSMPNFATKCAP